MSGPDYEIELIDNWEHLGRDSVWLGYEMDDDNPGWEGDPSAGPSYWQKLGRTFSVCITHWHDGKRWLPIEGPWTLLAPDYSEGQEVQEYTGWIARKL